MGGSLCAPKKKKTQIGASWVGNESENPFEVMLSKKDRVCLRETFQRLDDPKEVVAIIFVDIVNDFEPDLKKVFGVDRAPKAAQPKMPKFGGHIARFTDLIDQLTSMIGYTENLIGAWQLIRKTGRSHVRQGYLEVHQNQFEKNYFEVVLNIFIERFIPYLTGEQRLPTKEGCEKKKVRFANNYSASQIEDIWKKFFNILIAQMTDSFELERAKQRNAQSQKTLAPHQHIEQSERKKKRVQEKTSEIENTASSYEVAIQQESMHEDPF